MTIQPGHMMNIYKLSPGVVEIEFPNSSKDKYYCVGGFIFNSIMGPVHMNTGDMFHLDELELSRVQNEISKYQAQLKARDAKDQVEAMIALEALEPLEKELLTKQ
jgi:F0F1-type ATP synthase epsilon subunit